MENILIFGTGSRTEKVLKSLDNKKYHITAYIDNNKNNQGTVFHGVLVRGPEELSKLEYDKIVICSTAYKEIYLQLTETYKISPNIIENNLYFIKRKLIDYYEKQPNNNEEILSVVNYVKDNPLKVFNYDFTLKYELYQINIDYDNNVRMFYVIHNGKRMYFKKSFQKKDDVIAYYRFISQEQDMDSPHRYLIPELQVEKGDIVIDAGVAEGNFALDVIDDVSKIYLIEMVDEWIDALRETFKDYKDKVIFVNKCLSNFNDETNITIDKLLGKENPGFIKMDIEGGELNALQGASSVINRCEKLKMNICSYHNVEDEIEIKEFLKTLKLKISTSKGYIFFENENMYENDNPRLVKCLVRAVK